MRELEAALDEAARAFRQEVAEVHRSYKNEIVLYRPPGSEVTLRVDRRPR